MADIFDLEDPNEAGPTMKKCVACAEPISPEASLCKHCKSDQARWRNELKFWAGVTGVITLIASGLVFTANLGFDLWQRATGREIAITNLDPFGETVAWNLSSRPIVLTTVTIVSTAPENRLVWEVHDSIAANGRLPIDLMKIAGKSWHGPLEKFGKMPGEYAQVEPAVFEDLKKNRLTDKYIPTYFMPNSATYAQSRQALGDKLQTFDCTISIGFIRLWDGSTSSIDVPCKAAFRFRAANP